MKKSEYYKLFERCNELEKQNKELINSYLNCYKNCEFEDKLDSKRMQLDIKDILDRITGKSIEEILKEDTQ